MPVPLVPVASAISNYMETTSASSAGSCSHEKLNYFNFSRSLRHGTGCRYHKMLYGNALLAGNYAGIYAELSCIVHSNLITQKASIEILLLHGSNLHWLLNARYLLLNATCKLPLSVSNLKQVCEISCMHNENSEKTDTNIHRPTVSKWNAL